MAFVLVQSGVVVQKQPYAQAGFIAAPDNVVCGMVWNGESFVAPPPAPEAVPEEISNRQFAQQLALDGTITESEALAWAARGDLPAAMEAAVLLLPIEQQFSARMLLVSAKTYQRSHWLVPVLGALLDYDSPALDAVWRAAALL